MKLKKVIFNDQGFRNLRNLTIDIAPRITVIAGHNGIGKSTILGLIANGTEYKANKTLLNKKFSSDFSEIFYLDYQGDFALRNNGASTGNLVYEVDDTEITKVCTVTAGHKIIINQKQYRPFMVKVNKSDLTAKQIEDLEAKSAKEPEEKFIYILRVRLIPRTQGTQSKAAKVELPTIYLGMSRISPIGEFDKSAISYKKTQKTAATLQYINSFFNDVIPYQQTEDPNLYSHTFIKSNKQSLVPEFTHSSLAISLGQDSLSSIATAFASFKSLKDQIADAYRGGILVIDEIEAGLHPKAQLKLMNVIKREARNLDLQIIVTSHSLTILKFIFDIMSEKNPNPQDSIIYLMDTLIPRTMSNPTYSKIKNDMLLKKDPSSEIDVVPKIKIYFEDDEAKYFFEKILEALGITNSDSAFGREFEPISLKIGCEILTKLVKTDGYFQSAVLIADNDVASKASNRSTIEQYDNFCVLPGNKDFTPNTASYLRNPEMILYKFIESRLNDIETYRDFWNNSGIFTTDHVREHVVNKKPEEQKNRVSMKEWFNANLRYFDDMKIVELWCEENTHLVEDFIKSLGKAIDAAAQNVNIPIK